MIALMCENRDKKRQKQKTDTHVMSSIASKADLNMRHRLFKAYVE